MKSLQILALALSILSVSSQKVNFQFYYESICPGCYDYFIHTWKTAVYTPGLLEMFDLHLYPYGNAYQKQVGGSWVFDCQHGKKECYGNQMETCIIDLYPEEIHLKSIICLEEQEHVYKDFDNALKACALQFNLNVEKINTCINSPEGNRLQHEMGVATDGLNPPHEWVPWLVVDGKYSDKVQDEVYKNPVKYICKNYQGPAKVEACNKYIESSYDNKNQYCVKQPQFNNFLRKD